MEQSSYVYILASRPNGTLYVGVTSDIAQQVWQHKSKLVPGSFTAKHAINDLVYYEEHGDIMTAIECEKQLKSWRREWKIQLIEKENPKWVDLFEEICCD